MKIAAFLLLGAIAMCYGVTLPQSFERCKVPEDSDFKSNECLRKSINKALHDLKNGNSELKVPSLDPLKIDRMDIEQGSPSSPVSIELSFLKIDMIGISSMNLHNITGKLSSPDKWSLYLEGTMDTFQLVGDYVINGKILILPIVGNGKCNVTFWKPRVFVNIFGESKIKNGVEYLKITKYNFDENVQRIYFDFKNLFNGNELLSSSTNRFFNDNWRLIYTELRPSMDKAISKVVQIYAKKILEKIPFKDIFIVD